MAITEIIKVVSDVGSAIAGFAKVQTASSSLGSKLQSIGGTLQGLGAKVSLFTAPLAAGLGVAGKQAVDFQDAMSGASRALDLNAKELKAFQAEALKTAPALGMLPTKFAELATEAGKLGVAKDKIMGFAKVVAEIAAITDAPSTELAQSFAALQTITGATTDQLNIFGSAVNKLDDSIGGTTPQIIEFTRQTAATGKLLKLNIKNLAAYGSTMQSLGIQNGVAYRSFNSLLNKLAASQVLSKKAKEAFGDLGLNAQQMSRIMTTDANRGIEIFLTKIKEVAAVDTSRALGAVRQIVGEDYGDEILTLALSHEKLGQALGFVNDSYDKANLAKKNDELAKKLGSVKGQTAIARAQMERLGISIGSAVLPSLNSLLEKFTPLIEKFAAFAEQNPKIVQFGVAIGGVGIMAGSTLMIVGSLVSAIGSIGMIVPSVSGILGGLSIAGTGAGIAIGGITFPVWGVIAAFAALGIGIGALIAYWDKLPAPVKRAGENIKFYGGLIVQDIKAMPGNLAQVPGAIGAIMSSVGASFTRLRAEGAYSFTALKVGVDSMGGAIAAGFTRMGVEINYWVTSVKVKLQNLAASAWEAGAAFIRNLGAGIAAQFQSVISSFQSKLAQLRGMLPGSEPKIRSPLSNLAAAGSATMDNFASGFTQSGTNSALSGVLGGVRQGLSIPAPVAASGGGGNLVINDNRTINITGGGNNNGSDWIIDALRKSDRELLELIQKAQARWNRNR